MKQKNNSSQATQPSRNGSYHRPRSVEELTQRNISTIVELDEATKAERSRGEQMAERIAEFCGSMTFVWMNITIFGLWCGWNVLATKPLRFDPAPFFFLCFVVALEAIFLSTFVLISQNHERKLSERRNQLNLQVDLLSEQESTKMLQLLTRIAAKVGVPLDEHPEVEVLEEATRPDQLIEQIEEASQQTKQKEKCKAQHVA